MRAGDLQLQGYSRSQRRCRLSVKGGIAGRHERIDAVEMCRFSLVV